MFMVDISWYIYTYYGYKPAYNWGGHHPVGDVYFFYKIGLCSG